MTQEERARELFSEIFGESLLLPLSLRVARLNALINALENLRVQSFASMWRDDEADEIGE